jgi:hypothetical protein
LRRDLRYIAKAPGRAVWEDPFLYLFKKQVLTYIQFLWYRKFLLSVTYFGNVKKINAYLFHYSFSHLQGGENKNTITIIMSQHQSKIIKLLVKIHVLKIIISMRIKYYKINVVHRVQFCGMMYIRDTCGEL